MAELIMPKMGDAMTEGKVLRWIKQRGDTVQRGEAVAEIETDKVNVELPAEEAGTLAEILVAEGQTAAVGSPIAIIARPAEEAGAGKQQATASRPAEPRQKADARAPEAATPAPQAETASERDRVPPEERIKASPLARRLAREQGLDLAEIQGSGPEGRITKEDIEAFLKRRGKATVPPDRAAEGAPVAASPPVAAPPPLTAEEVPLTRMRQTIARRMAESKQHAPHFYVTVEVLMDEALSIRRQLNEGLGEKIVSVNDLVMKAAALALRRFPNLNASFAEDKVRRHGEIHMGMAVALDAGLLVPVIRDCDRKSVVEIAGIARELGERARAGRLRPDELQGATFTVSNLGMYDVESFVAIINPPQAGIIAVGTALPRAIVETGGQIRAAHVMKATISADHRVTDGAEAARYMAKFKRLLQNPALLLIDLSDQHQ